MSSTSDQRRRRGATLREALGSWRTASVSLLSFSSGLPLGLVWIAIPDWMRKSGIDIRIVGLVTLAHAPWMFKVLWSPLMDRFAPPWLGRRRGWIAITQVALFAVTLLLAGVGDHALAGPQHEVVGVRQHDLGTYRPEIFDIHGLDRGPGADRHEVRSLHLAVGSRHHTAASRPIGRSKMPGHCAHLGTSTNIASPNDRNRYSEANAWS